MCEYCKNVDTGDDFKELVENNLDFGFLGEINIGVSLSKSGATPVLVLGTVALNGDSFENKSVHINYCPICGRKLSVL